MRAGYRVLTDGSMGPGPNCPIRYTVDPDIAARNSCVQAYKKLLAVSDKSPTVLEAVAASERWLEVWHKENNRLVWFYLTLRKGLSDPKYAHLFQDFHSCYELLRLIRAPNQVGKTYAAVAEIYFYCLGWHPWRKLDPKWSDPTVKKIVLVVTGSEKNRLGYFEALWALCPIMYIDWTLTCYDDRNGWGVRNPVIIFPKTNTKIVFRSSNQDTDSLNSLTCDLCSVDEPPKQETVDEIRRACLAKKAPIIMTFTPVGEDDDDFTWLRTYVEGDEEWRETEGLKGVPPRGNWKQFHIGLPDCPWFSAAEIEERLTAFREEQIGPRVYGDWNTKVINASFSHFSLKHTVVRSWTFTENTRFFIGVDHGEKAYTEAIVIGAYDPKGDACILGEVVNISKTTAEDDALALWLLLDELKVPVHAVTFFVGDINSGGKESRGEKLNILMRKELQRLSKGKWNPFIRIPDKYPGSVETGERRLNAAFQVKRLFVHARCRKLIDSLQRYTGGTSEKDKKLKHFLDALRYPSEFVLDTMRVATVYSHSEAVRFKAQPNKLL